MTTQHAPQFYHEIFFDTPGQAHAFMREGHLAGLLPDAVPVIVHTMILFATDGRLNQSMCNAVLQITSEKNQARWMCLNYYRCEICGELVNNVAHQQGRQVCVCCVKVENYSHVAWDIDDARLRRLITDVTGGDMALRKSLTELFRLMNKFDSNQLGGPQG